MASSSSSSKEHDEMDLEKDSNTQDDTTVTNTPQLPGLLPNGLEKHQSPHAAESEKARYQVDWEEGDPKNPRNFSFWYKSWITFQLGMLALAASTASSIISPASDVISAHFNISSEVTVLNVSLYILGFAFGPLLWAPISELWGRRWSIIPAMYALTLFSIGTATSTTPAAMFITRFFGGLFGSAPVSNVSAALGDIYEPKARGFAISLYAIAVVGGPTLAPVSGAALVMNPALGWRWTEYITAIWVFTVATVAFFCIPEIYGPVLLKNKAKRLRKETGDQRYWHPHEENKLDLKSIVTKHFARPMLMLTTEPMVTCIAFYASFVYSLLYLSLEVFPIVFLENREWGLVVSTLPFLALFVGVLAALTVNLANQPRYARIVDQNNGKPVPEARLAPMAIGGVIFAIGLFWFGWTAAPNIPWPAPVVAAAFIGAGFNIIFNQCINFLVDTYGIYAASATSANTFLRSIFAAGLPLAAMSILGGVACLALPVPFLFMRYGLKLRKMSKFAPVVEDDR
jgi:MFS family permease